MSKQVLSVSYTTIELVKGFVNQINNSPDLPQSTPIKSFNIINDKGVYKANFYSMNGDWLFHVYLNAKSLDQAIVELSERVKEGL